MNRWLFLIPMALVVIVEVVAYRHGWITGPVAVGIFLGLEAIIAGAALYKDSNHPIRKLMTAELQSWHTLFLLLRGQFNYPPGAIPLYGHRRWYQIPAMLTGAVVIEIIAIELLVPFAWLRLVLLVLSVYSLVLLWALFAGIKVHPSFIFRDQLVLRRGRKIIATLPLSLIADISYQRGYTTDLQLVQDATITLGSTEGTNIAIRLAAPIQVPATGYFWQHRSLLDIQYCHLWLDDPNHLINLK